MYKIAVFAGTSEGRTLIERLSGRGLGVTAFVATEYGEVALGRHEGVETRAGALPRAEMPGVFRAEGFDLVVDATHPYAEHITESIRLACEDTGTAYLRLQRGSTSSEEDGVFVADTAECIRFLQSTEGKILLTTGSKTLSEFCADPALRERIYARVLPMESSLESCRISGLTADRIIAMQGPFTEEMNVAMLRFTGAKWLVTKDTGKAGGYADKIRAARAAGAAAVIIGLPPQCPGLSPEEALAEIEKRFALPGKPKRVILAGIGVGSEDSRTLGVLRAVRESECVIGAKRMLQSVDTAGKRTYTAILAADIARIIRTDGAETITVLFSGDTGFYSGTKSLLRELEGADVRTEILPGVGSLSYFCARLGRPWEDVRPVSLHGRNCDIAREVREHTAVFSLLGGDAGANEALARLEKAGFGALRAHVGENLGYENEKISSGSVSELAGGPYGTLSVLLVENPGADSVSVTYGLPDEAFDRDKVPMTKEEVRAVCVSKLALSRGAVVYDVGSGSGSVSVECARVAYRGRVYAIEQKDTAIALTRQNAEKFSLINLEVVPGSAPEALEPLEAPTHAFIGGSSGNLRQIVELLLVKNPAVRIVATAVTLETVAELTELSNEFEISDVAEIQVNKPRKVGRYHLSNAQNPVYIFTFQYRKSEE
ncbi:MAG: precorrin-6A reductase [Oscillospiraceae bacterium]|nr:precorrin-6A reductase [Oscillospiraceae bacterium]